MPRDELLGVHHPGTAAPASSVRRAGAAGDAVAGDAAAAAVGVGELLGCLDDAVGETAEHDVSDIGLIVALLTQSLDRLPSLLCSLAAVLDAPALLGGGCTDRGVLRASVRTLRSVARIVAEVNPVPPLRGIATDLTNLRP